MKEKTVSRDEDIKTKQFANPARSVMLQSALGTGVVGLLTIGAHAWFLDYLHSEYNQSIADKSNVIGITDYVDLWVPIFILSMLAENGWARYKAVRLYRVNDTLCSLSLGILSLLTKKITAKAMLFFPYVYLWNNFAVTHAFVENGALGWWLMFLGKEFSYYWAHRQGHTISAFWAMHSVHHSSEEYNLSAALRQSSLFFTVSWLYDLPMALFFPPALFVIHAQFNLLYQFWIHTPVVGKLGPLEWILNTPSQHRVHHGKNPYCIDKNYGGTLCLFDRLFGTFQEELEHIPIVYGVVHPINTFNPVEANLINWRESIIPNIWSLRGLRNKLGAVFFGPGWIPGAASAHDEYPIPPTSTDSTTKYDPYLSTGAAWYVCVQYVWALVLLTVAIDQLSTTLTHTSIFSAYIAWTLLNVGGITDRKRWVLASELLRLLVALPLSAYINTLIPSSTTSSLSTLIVTTVVLSSVCALWLWRMWPHLARPIRPETELGRSDPTQALIDQTEQYRRSGLKAD